MRAMLSWNSHRNVRQCEDTSQFEQMGAALGVWLSSDKLC